MTGVDSSLRGNDRQDGNGKNAGSCFPARLALLAERADENRRASKGRRRRDVSASGKARAKREKRRGV